MSAAAVIILRRKKFIRRFAELGATSPDRAIPFDLVGMRRSWIFDQMVSRGVFVGLDHDRFLRESPEAPEGTSAGAWQQCWNWYLAASLAAQRDLSPGFVEDWHMPLLEGTRKAFASVDWKQPELTPAMVDRWVKAVSAKIFADQ